MQFVMRCPEFDTVMPLIRVFLISVSGHLKPARAGHFKTGHF